MLFSAGMGIGLMFYGVAEPLMHFSSPPIGESGTTESAKQAMKITFFHWGLHASRVRFFGSYSRILLLPKIFRYFLVQSHPFIGDKIHGRIGDADTFVVIGTMFELPLLASV